MLIILFPDALGEKDYAFHVDQGHDGLPQLNDVGLIINLNQLDSMDRFAEQQLSNLKQTWEENALA